MRWRIAGNFSMVQIFSGFGRWLIYRLNKTHQFKGEKVWFTFGNHILLKSNHQNFFWSIYWHFHYNLHLWKFPAIRYYEMMQMTCVFNNTEQKELSHKSVLYNIYKQMDSCFPHWEAPKSKYQNALTCNTTNKKELMNVSL